MRKVFTDYFAWELCFLHFIFHVNECIRVCNHDANLSILCKDQGITELLKQWDIINTSINLFIFITLCSCFELSIC